MESLNLKVSEENLEEHLMRIWVISAMNKEEPYRKTRNPRLNKG